MGWFARDHTGRELSALERDFVNALRALLTEMHPPQLDESETALTAEGRACVIVLLPHRALGGIAVVVWLFGDRAEVTWAQVADLGRYHDALDAGVSVAQFNLDAKQPNFGPLLQSIREQFTTPLTLRLYGADRATVHVRDHRGVLRRVGEIGASPGWFQRLWPGDPTRETTVRFSDEALPPLAAPSGVDTWFASGGHGA
jgi:hypothetical protein